MDIEVRITELKSELEAVLSAPLLNYDSAKKLLVSGVYVIYDGDDIIYVGKTNRNGKTRFRELATDYRSHTLNRKLLREEIESYLKVDFPPLRKETKHNLISRGILSESEFLSLQGKVNERIKTGFKFKFLPLPQDRVAAVEYFIISVLDPKYNT